MSNIQTEIALTHRVVNGEAEIYNQIKNSGTQKNQLQKAATEFESIFVSKILEKMESSVDKEGGIFGGEGDYVKNFKSFIFQQMGRDVANNPLNSFGLAKQIYKQMEAALPREPKVESEV